MNAKRSTDSAPAQVLPRVIPIFPLPGVILLPRGSLPLNIFEPRYLAMTRDALAGDGVIGMIQPRDPQDAHIEPAVYPTGCLGRIEEHRDLPDGRILITLKGLCRFDVEQELEREAPYRLVTASYLRYPADVEGGETLDPAAHEHLLNILQRYLDDRQLAADWSVVRHAPDETLVNALSMICPFEPNEKQALLEAVSLSDRAHTLVTIMKFALADAGDPPASAH